MRILIATITAGAGHLPFRLEQLLDSKKLAEIGDMAKSLGRPAAAPDICRAVAEKCLARPAPV